MSYKPELLLGKNISIWWVCIKIKNILNEDTHHTQQKGSFFFLRWTKREKRWRAKWLFFFNSGRNFTNDKKMPFVPDNKVSMSWALWQLQNQAQACGPLWLGQESGLSAKQSSLRATPVPISFSLFHPPKCIC